MVRLVQHEGLDTVEAQLALLLQVQQAAGTADDDLRSSPQRIDLFLGGYTAENGHGLDAREAGQVANLRVDLARQFAGRRHDQDPGSGSIVGQEFLEQRQCEGRGLAGSGLGQAQDVAALEGSGNGAHLDRARFHEADGLDAALELGAQREVGEAGGGFNSGVRHTLWSLRQP